MSTNNIDWNDVVKKEVKSRKFGTKVRDILKEEQNHLEMCTKLAKQNISKE